MPPPPRALACPCWDVDLDAGAVPTPIRTHKSRLSRAQMVRAPIAIAPAGRWAQTIHWGAASAVSGPPTFPPKVNSEPHTKRARI